MISRKLQQRLTLLMVFAASLLTLPGFAQDAPPPVPAPPVATEQQPMQVGPTIKKESRLVLVDTVVTDKKGKYLPDLTKNNFPVFQNTKNRPLPSSPPGPHAP